MPPCLLLGGRRRGAGAVGGRERHAPRAAAEREHDERDRQAGDAAARNAVSSRAMYSGSHRTGASAFPVNLNAPTTDTAPPRFAGALSTASVLSPAQTNDEPAPATSHAAAITPTEPASPSAATIAEQTSAPAITTGRGPEPSTSPPAGRPASTPAKPNPARSRPRSVVSSPKGSAARSATRNATPLIAR